MSKGTWTNTKYPGVRYRLHPTRKHGVQRDRYFAIRYYVDGKRIEEGLGWASEGMTAQEAARTRANLRAAAKQGDGPRTMGEKREEAEAERAAKQKAREADARRNVSFKAFFDHVFMPDAETRWKPETARKARSMWPPGLTL